MCCPCQLLCSSKQHPSCCSHRSLGIPCFSIGPLIGGLKRVQKSKNLQQCFSAKQNTNQIYLTLKNGEVQQLVVVFASGLPESLPGLPQNRHKSLCEPRGSRTTTLGSGWVKPKGKTENHFGGRCAGVANRNHGDVSYRNNKGECVLFPFFEKS